MFVGLFLSLAVTLSAGAGEWPTIREISVGDTFKYPLLGIPGASIRPTQEAVGFLAVEEKRKDYEKLTHDELKEMLQSKPIPVVAAPDGNFYMIDHHHQALAANKAGRDNAYFILDADYSKLGDMPEFWNRMREKKWVREFDHLGNPLKIPEGLPKSILGLQDDPFRSLAWFVRKAGGFQKSSIEFAEFAWADFFRTRVQVGKTRKDMNAATKKALALAHSSAASSLPGWDPKGVDCRSWLAHNPGIHP